MYKDINNLDDINLEEIKNYYEEEYKKTKITKPVCNEKSRRNLAVGRKIKEIRQINKLTQKELASILGVGRTTIVGYEKGDIAPSTDVMLKIFDRFNVDFADIGKSQNQQSYDLEAEIGKLVTNIKMNKVTFNDNKLVSEEKIIAISTLNNLIQLLKDIYTYDC